MLRDNKSMINLCMYNGLVTFWVLSFTQCNAPHSGSQCEVKCKAMELAVLPEHRCVHGMGGSQWYYGIALAY